MENQEDPSFRMHKAIDRLADEFEAAFLAGLPQTIERILQENLELRIPLLRELIAIEVELRQAAGSKPDLKEFLGRFPNDRELVESVFVPTTELASTRDRSLDSSDAKYDSPLPKRLGRYAIHSLLGKGGFGFVYLAHDPQLDRQVAIKVPRPERFTSAEQVNSFLQEARTAAKLKHKGFVAVYDVQEESGVPYIVQEFIEGGNLAVWSAHRKPSFEQIARILVSITEALGYLHQQCLTHCDLKLANVLMDPQGQPHIADFGWAMQDSMRASHQGARFGTPIIMAPEQVRGEGHRLDGRTDIWAVGVMLYELLVNQRPFTSRGLSELFNEIETLDPRPPRQIDSNVPRDLERICLRCLQKRRTDRYSTAEDLREDLQLWLANASSDSTLTVPGRDSPDSPPRLHGTWWGGLVLAALLLGLGIQQWISSERWINLQEQTQTAVDALQNNPGPSVPFNLEKLATLPNELVLSELHERFTSVTNANHKMSLAFALARFGEPNTSYLISGVEEIGESDTRNYIIALKADVPGSLKTIQAESTSLQDESLWRRKAKLAVVALNLGDSSLANEMCEIENRPNPGQRTLFVDEFPRWENDLKSIHSLVSSIDNAALRSGICLAVGQIALDKLSGAEKECWQALAAKWFIEQADSTTHSGAGWLLQRWGIEKPKARDRGKIVSKRDWFVNSIDMTMLKMKPHVPVTVQLQDPLQTFRDQLLAVSNPDTELDDFDIRRTRAIANYMLGNMELALNDLDWVLTQESAVNQEKILAYRILAMARLGKADEVKVALASNPLHRIEESIRVYVDIQVPAWLGDYTEAAVQLESALAGPYKSVRYRYNVARAVALCSKAAMEDHPEHSKQFADRTMEILNDLVNEGYNDNEQLYSEPDFAHFHKNEEFLAFIDGRIEEFWVADREVSRGQLELFMNETSYPEKEVKEKWRIAQNEISPTAAHPAQHVSWPDAVLFCNWLSEREGREPCYERTGKTVQENGMSHPEMRIVSGRTGYRLLYEREWEYACRAGTQTEYSLGNYETLLNGYCEMYPSKLAAVCGEKLPNGWGLHDMHGNVWEWCEDWFDDTPSFRVFRGGCWFSDANNCRTAERGRRIPILRDEYYLGFRIALNASLAQSEATASKQ